MCHPGKIAKQFCPGSGEDKRKGKCRGCWAAARGRFRFAAHASTRPYYIEASFPDPGIRLRGPGTCLGVAKRRRMTHKVSMYYILNTIY